MIFHKFLDGILKVHPRKQKRGPVFPAFSRAFQPPEVAEALKQLNRLEKQLNGGITNSTVAGLDHARELIASAMANKQSEMKPIKRTHAARR